MSSFFIVLIDYTFQILTHLIWAFEFLFHHFLFHHRQLIPVPPPTSGLRPYTNPARPGPGHGPEPAECAVCFWEIEEGELAEELRCGHLFHGDCLDRWLGYRQQNPTYPLSRSSPMAAATRLLVVDDDQIGEEVIIFDSCSFRVHKNQDAWWAR